MGKTKQPRVKITPDLHFSTLNYIKAYLTSPNITPCFNKCLHDLRRVYYMYYDEKLFSSEYLSNQHESSSTME